MVIFNDLEYLSKILVQMRSHHRHVTAIGDVKGGQIAATLETTIVQMASLKVDTPLECHLNQVEFLEASTFGRCYLPECCL